MDDEESEKIKDMVAPKPSFVPRRMQMGGEAAGAGAGAGGAAGATPAAKKAEVVYTPASDGLLEVKKRVWSGDDVSLLVVCDVKALFSRC